MMLMVWVVAAINRTSKYGELKARRNLEQKVAGGELENLAKQHELSDPGRGRPNEG